MIFQDPRAHVDPLWRVGDHIGEPLRLPAASATDVNERSRAMLDAVGIADPDLCLRSYPDQLSGGMLSG